MWTSERPIKELDFYISRQFASMANIFYKELASQSLQVELVEAPFKKHPNHKIRVVNEFNPGWYKEIYERHSYNRTYKSRKTNRKRQCLESRVKRKTSLNSLGRISSFSDKEYRIDWIYRDFIYERLTEGYEEEGFFILPKNEVRSYFGLEELDPKEISRLYNNVEENPLRGDEYKVPLENPKLNENSGDKRPYSEVPF